MLIQYPSLKGGISFASPRPQCSSRRIERFPSNLGDARIGHDRPPVEEDECVELHGRPPGHLRVVMALVQVVAAAAQTIPAEEAMEQRAHDGGDGAEQR